MPFSAGPPYFKPLPGTIQQMREPVVELSECIQCGVCVEACPAAFRLNAMGYVEVIALSEYPEPEVDEAIKDCPPRCIRWGPR